MYSKKTILILMYIGIAIVSFLGLKLFLDRIQIGTVFLDCHKPNHLTKQLFRDVPQARKLIQEQLDVKKEHIQKQPISADQNLIQNNQSLILRKVFNEENRNKKIQDLQKFHIKVNPPIQRYSFISALKQVGIYNKIQVGSFYDYAGITEDVNFQLLSKQLLQSISYELISFAFDSKLQKQESKIQMVNFKDKIDQNSINIDARVAQPLIRQPDNPYNRQMEYYFYNEKYKIGTIKTQLPICVFSTGYKMFSKNKFAEFFRSVQRQNYTNFHIVYVDDNSPESDVQGIIKFMQQNNMRIRNKIQIVHNLQHLGAMGNMYFWINKYCNKDDIVINIDSDDGLIGAQVFKVINSQYQDPSVWFLYSRYVLTENNHQKLYNGFSQPLRTKTSDYRNTIKLWDVSHIRTFRQKVFSKIPLQMLLQYHLNQTTNMAAPHFYSSAVDAYQIFTLLQLGGDDRFRFVSNYLYLYFGSNTNQGNKKCYSQHEKFDELKARIKTPMNRLKSIDDIATQIVDYSPSFNTFSVFKNAQRKYRQC